MSITTHIFFLVMEPVKIYSLSNFIKYTIQYCYTMLYILYPQDLFTLWLEVCNFCPLSHISPSPNPLPLGINLFSVSVRLLFSLCKISYVGKIILIFLCFSDISFNMIISRSTHIATNGIISVFLWLSNIPLFILAHLS